LSSDAPIEKSKLRELWKKIHPAKKTLTSKSRIVFLKRHENQRSVIYYAFFGKKNKPRISCPWAGLPGLPTKTFTRIKKRVRQKVNN